MNTINPLGKFAAMCAAAFLTVSSAVGATDPRFGVMTHFAQGWAPSDADTVAGIPIGTVRDELYWAQVETTPGVYAFPPMFDAYMARLKRDGIAPLIILDFENPLYDGGNTPYTAKGIAAYANYCVAVLDHYGSQIQSVEIWNEYNGSFSKGPATTNLAGTYTAMLKQAYTRIKAVRPDVTVVGGSTSGTPLPYWQELMEDGALPYMDALSIHPYRYDSPPEGIENDVASLRSLVMQYNSGQTKPIWVTEIGWEEQAAPLLVDDLTLAKYVTRVYSLLISAGVETTYWYLLRDDYNEPMGLYNSDMTPKSAATAMATLIGELSGAPFVQQETTPSNIYSMLFQRATGEQVRILWTTLPNLSLSLAGVTRAVDMLGNSLGTAGDYTLSDAPIFVEGNVTGIPAPSLPFEVAMADSVSDFSGVQGYRGWTYGYSDGSAAFTPMPTYTSNLWNNYWTAKFSYLSITAVDVHPSLDGAADVSALRRWTSNFAGVAHIIGDFQCGSQGDGVGVSILVNGHTALPRQLIGASNSLSENFDFYQNVGVGSTIDFVVDVGPASNMNYDATSFSAQIRTSFATAATAAPEKGAVLANSAIGFSGTQGANGWSYGDYRSEGSTSFQAASSFASDAWSGNNQSFMIGAASQQPIDAVAVRRWTSDYAGTINVQGDFQAPQSVGGDGVYVLVDGKPLVPRTLIGSSQPSSAKAFNFAVTVARGSTVDFAVDPGASANVSSESPFVTAIISFQ